MMLWAIFTLLAASFLVEVFLGECSSLFPCRVFVSVVVVAVASAEIWSRAERLCAG